MSFTAQVHHLCTLLGYGADAVCPYLGIAALFAMQQDGKIPAGMSPADIESKYTKALNMGVLKVRVPPDAPHVGFASFASSEVASSPLCGVQRCCHSTMDELECH